MQPDEAIERASQVKTRYEKELMKRANVIGVGIGYKYKNGQLTDEIVLIVNVSDKKPVAELAKEDLLPREIDGVPVDVQEIGPIRAY